MQITDLLKPESIALHREISDKRAAVHELAVLMSHAQNLRDAAAFEEDVLAREAQTSTEVGGGIAIPHAKSAAVERPGLAALTLEPGVPSELGGEPVRLLFLIAAPENSDVVHVQMLSRLATMLMDPGIPGRLAGADTAEEFLQIIGDWEQAEQARSRPAAPRRTTYKLLAVTACPAGLAHTFLAAEALQNAARELDVSLKVETNGATGPENVLTTGEITAASCIIVAADKAVAMERFAGKPVLKVPVSAAVRSARALLEEALSGEVPRLPDRMDAPPQPSRFARAEKGLKGQVQARLHNGYIHLMSGVSHMLPFLIGGGLLIALSFLLDNLGVNRNWTWMLKTVGQGAIDLMYPVLAGYIASSMAGEMAFVPAMLGGWLAQAGVTLQPQQYWTTSGFWGTLVAGFGAGLLTRLLRRIGDRLPRLFDQIKNTMLFPMLAVGLVGTLMVFWVNPPLCRFNGQVYHLLNNLGDVNRVVLGAVLGALMASDYGGPINKAAYLFGTVAIVNDQFDIMASVMAGGMAPSLAVALCCLMFPDRFTESEKRTVPQNFLLGISFVTEGALPFALKDPLRVVPSCLAGSAVAGALAMIFRCQCPAPHGGLFLLPVMEEPILFVLALFVGSLLSAVMMGLLKKPLPVPVEEGDCPRDVPCGQSCDKPCADPCPRCTVKKE